MKVKVLLRNGTYLEGNLYRDSQLQNQLATREAMGDYFKRMYNRVYFVSDCLKADFSTMDVDFWDIVENKTRGHGYERARI